MTQRILRQLLLAGLSIALSTALLDASPALASGELYPGQDVTVNLSAIPGYRQPAKMRLHLPARHRIAAKKTADAASEPGEESGAAALTPKTPHKSAAKQLAAAVPPAPQPAPAGSGTAAIPFSFEPSAEAPKPPEAKPQASIAPVRKPTPEKGSVKGLAKQASVLFDAGSPALSDNTTATLNDLAFSLKTALASGGDRIEIIGFGGQPGEKSSAARRLSLERALAVRQALVVDGVPVDRIDVKALGGVEDSGATDRVDIFVKS